MLSYSPHLPEWLPIDDLDGEYIHPGALLKLTMYGYPRTKRVSAVGIVLSTVRYARDRHRVELLLGDEHVDLEYTEYHNPSGWSWHIYSKGGIQSQYQPEVVEYYVNS